MPETWNLVRKYTYTCSFRKYTFQCQNTLNFADASIFGKNGTFTQSNSVRAVWDFLVLFSVFVRWKVIFNENVSLKDKASEILLLDCSKLARNRKYDNDVTICRHNVIIFLYTKTFYCCWTLSQFSFSFFNIIFLSLAMSSNF